MREKSGHYCFMSFVEMVISRHHLLTSTTSIALVFAGFEIQLGQYSYTEQKETSEMRQ